MAKKVTKKSAPKKLDKFSQTMLVAETVQRMDEILSDVKGSKSSVFAKDDVIKIISEIKESFNQNSPTVLLSLEEFIDELADNIAHNISEQDLDSVDLSMSGNEVYIDNIRIDNQRVKELIEEVTDNYLK